MSIFKSYFQLLFIYFCTIVVGKIIFFLYLQDSFADLSLFSAIYAIFWGVKFDLAASAFLVFFAILLGVTKKIFAFIAALFLVIIINIEIGDIFYFSESGRHISYEIFDLFTDASSLFLTAYYQHFWLTISTIIVSVVLFVVGFNFWQNHQTIAFNRYYLVKQIMLLLLTVFFVRGMFQGIPLNPWQAGQLADNARSSLALNATYSVIFSLITKDKVLKKMKIPTVSEDISKQSMTELYPKNKEKLDLPILKNKPNVVMLFLESWSAKYMQSYGFKHQTTPFFDAILSKSIRPRVMVAGGHRTSEGVFSSLTSLQNPLGKTVAKTQLQDKNYHSIIKYLNSAGYQSLFFQGTNKETSGVGSFVQSLGFVESFGKKDIKKNNYASNNWGVQDPDLYDFAIKKLAQTKTPFVVGINGATTHDLILPKDFTQQKFVKDTDLNTMLNTYVFADQALKIFVEKMQEKYPNTVFVLFADHTGSRLVGALENYLIPFAIYAPSMVQANFKDVVLSQRDIAPSIYDLVLGDYHNKGFSGKSIFRDEKYFADYFHNSILGWVEGEKIVEINVNNNELKCFTLEKIIKKNVTCSKQHNRLKNHALSWTNFYQDLIFLTTDYDK